MPLVTRLAICVVVAVGLAGCLDDAPHSNPLDPLSDAPVTAGEVSGRVTGISPPFDGRGGVRVRVMPQGGGTERVTTTATDGTFTLDGIPGGRILVVAEADGLAEASVETDVVAGSTSEVLLQLNALPVVTAQAARTVHIERWFPDVPVFRLEVEADVTDPDRPSDVDAVALVVESLGFRAPLMEVGPGRYEAALDAAALPGGQVQSLLGQALRIEVTDVAGAVALGPPLALVRVIEQTPLTASPQGLVTLAANPPVLEWRPAALPFAFTYRADVFLIDGAGIPNLIQSADGLSPATTTLPLAAALVPGDYYWTIWVTDAAGNRSRSKEAGFRVP